MLQIRCKECDYVSEREETYLDLTLAVRGYSDIGESLADCYLNTETLSGSNQYMCQRCDKLVDAEKVKQLLCEQKMSKYILINCSNH